MWQSRVINCRVINNVLIMLRVTLKVNTAHTKVGFIGDFLGISATLAIIYKGIVVFRVNESVIHIAAYWAKLHRLITGLTRGLSILRRHIFNINFFLGVPPAKKISPYIHSAPSG
jgi:hypothetical protein